MNAPDLPDLVAPTPVAHEERYRLWFAGVASEDWFGLLGGSFVVEHPDGEKYRAPFVVGKGTIDEAEYRSLIAGLRYLAGVVLDPALVVVSGESALVINQVFGTRQVSAPSLRPLHAEARALVRSLATVGIRCEGQWIPREQNTEAVALCQQVKDKLIKGD